MNGGTSALANGQLRISNNNGAANGKQLFISDTPLLGNNRGSNAPYLTPSRAGGVASELAKVSPLPLPGIESPFLNPKASYAFPGTQSLYSQDADLNGR